MSGKNLQFDLNVNALESNDEEEVIGETSDGNSGNGHQDVNLFSNQPKRKRHTQEQIEQLEAFFNVCPNPDSKQRKVLGLRIALEPLQVKFWFQNKRTQLKAQHGQQENVHLREQNTWLRAENLSYKEAIKDATCYGCGGPLILRDLSREDYKLHLENQLLKTEVHRITAAAEKYTGEVFARCTNFPPPSSS